MNRNQLLESRDFWRTSTEHDKRQLLLSLGIGGAGLFLAGVGIIGTVAGAPEVGVPAVVFGGALTYLGTKDASSELNDMLEMQALTSQRELQLHELGAED